MACVPRERTGMASGLSTTTRFGAIVLAIGIFGGVLASRSEQLLRQALQQLAPDQLSHVAAMATRVAAGDMPAALALVAPGLRDAVAPLAQQAFTGGLPGDAGVRRQRSLGTRCGRGRATGPPAARPGAATGALGWLIATIFPVPTTI
jgi:hypothetical protein